VTARIARDAAQHRRVHPAIEGERRTRADAARQPALHLPQLRRPRKDDERALHP